MALLLKSLATGLFLQPKNVPQLARYDTNKESQETGLYIIIIMARVPLIVI